MHNMDAKTQKIEPDPNNFMMDESFGGSVQWPCKTTSAHEVFHLGQGLYRLQGHMMLLCYVLT